MTPGPNGGVGGKGHDPSFVLQPQRRVRYNERATFPAFFFLARTTKVHVGHHHHHERLLDPMEMWPILPMPASLSPTSIGDFLACPQSFLFLHLYRMKPPPTPAQTRGIVVHSMLENASSQLPPADDRTIGNLRALHQQRWKEHWTKSHSAPRRSPSSTRSTAEWLVDEQAKDELAIHNALRMEAVTNAEAVGHEVPVGAFVPVFGHKSVHEASPFHTFRVCGIMDRLNMVRVGTCSTRNPDDDTEDPAVLEIVDVKTSPPPFSDPDFDTNHQLNLVKLHIYSLLLHEEQDGLCRRQECGASVEYGSSPIGEEPKLLLPVRFLNLPYLLPDRDGRVHCLHTTWAPPLGSERKGSAALDAFFRSCTAGLSDW